MATIDEIPVVLDDKAISELPAYSSSISKDDLLLISHKKTASEYASYSYSVDALARKLAGLIDDGNDFQHLQISRTEFQQLSSQGKLDGNTMYFIVDGSTIADLYYGSKRIVLPDESQFKHVKIEKTAFDALSAQNKIDDSTLYFVLHDTETFKQQHMIPDYSSASIQRISKAGRWTDETNFKTNDFAAPSHGYVCFTYVSDTWKTVAASIDYLGQINGKTVFRQYIYNTNTTNSKTSSNSVLNSLPCSIYEVAKNDKIAIAAKVPFGTTVLNSSKDSTGETVLKAVEAYFFPAKYVEQTESRAITSLYFGKTKVDAIGNGSYQYKDLTKDTAMKEVFDMIYPIGSVYMSMTDSIPAAFKGEWQRIAQGKCLWGADKVNAAGSTIAAGLPNITGQFNGVCASTIANGCFAYTGDTKGAEHGKSNNGISFDASRSSSIYGSSDTVQPPALVVSIWQRMQ